MAITINTSVRDTYVKELITYSKWLTVQFGGNGSALRGRDLSNEHSAEEADSPLITLPGTLNFRMSSVLEEVILKSV